MSWIKEFGAEYAVPAEVIALYERGLLEDASWHNDVSPRFISPDHTREFWIDHPDEDRREMGLDRFRVYATTGEDLDSCEATTLYEGNNINAAIAAFTQETK